MTYAIRVRLQGSEDTVRSRLDDLLVELHEFAVYVDATPHGAALKAGRAEGMFDEARWAALCQRMTRGTTHVLCIDRNTFFPQAGLFTAMHTAGLTMAHCWFWLGDRVMGTEINLEYRRDDDLAISADDFRSWVDRIEAVSGMSRIWFEQIDEKPEPTTIIDLASLELGDASYEYGEHAQAWLESMMSPPSEVEGISISGWDSLGDEMELAIVGASPLSSKHRATVEETLRAWVDHGTEVGYGGGHLHGWTPGEWESNRYYVTVDSGAQLVDWPAAISDLAKRIARKQSVIASPLSIKLGRETE